MYFYFAVAPEFGDHKFKEKIIVVAGSNMTFDIPFSASPEPEATWTYKGGRLPDMCR